MLKILDALFPSKCPDFGDEEESMDSVMQDNANDPDN